MSTKTRAYPAMNGVDIKEITKRFAADHAKLESDNFRMAHAIATVAEILEIRTDDGEIDYESISVLFSVNGFSIIVRGPKGFQTNEMDTLDNAVEDALVIAGCL